MNTAGPIIALSSRVQKPRIISTSVPGALGSAVARELHCCSALVTRASSPQGSEAHGRSGHERPIHTQLGAVVVAVNRQLHEAVELKVVGEGVDEARAQEHGFRSAQIRLRVCARVLCLDQAVDLQQGLPILTEGITVTDVELELVAWLVFLLGAHAQLM